MANVIGLDVGSHAVRAVELSLGRGRPVVRRMGQVALAPGAVVAGEVVDPASVSVAIRRLWREAGFSGRSVITGVANGRVVARIAEFPDLPEDELRSSLPFRVQDLIPIPLEEAQLDFQVIDRVRPEDGEARVRVLLVAAHKDMLGSLLDAVTGAGLRTARVDLVPLALVRALHDPGHWLLEDGPMDGQEAIIGVGAAVTNVVVHENGTPRFVRTLPVGGAAVTEAIAVGLGVGAEAAETVKRSLPMGPGADWNAENLAAGAAAPLVADVMGSLDFHFAQVGESRLRRVVVTGGGGRLDLIRNALAEQLSVPVTVGNAMESVQLGDTGIEPAVVEASADLFTVALGLALSGQPADGGLRRISLLPGDVVEQRKARQQNVMVGAGVGVFAALLLGLAYVRGTQVDDARSSANRAKAQVTALTTQAESLNEVEKLESELVTRRQVVKAALVGDIAWPRLIREVATVMPEDVWLTSFSATRGDATKAGTISIAATGRDHTSTARWLQRLSLLPDATNGWVASSTKAGVGTTDVVTFSSTANLTPEAQSGRADRLTETHP